MRYRLIEAFTSEEEATTLWNQQSFPTPSLLKDERGLRVLLVQGEEIPVSVWAAASLGGATYLYRPNGLWLTAEEFLNLADLSDTDALYRIPTFIWHLGVDTDVFDAPGPSEGQQEGLYEEDEPVEKVEEAFEAAEKIVTAPTGTFVHLHCHSEFSALDGLATPKEIVAEAVRQGNTAVAVTDHGNVAGHPFMQEECEKAGIKPIFGMEGYLVEDRFSREGSDYYHITLWAMNKKGLDNLWAISTEGERDGFHNRPRVDWDTLQRLNEGVIIGSGCLRGPLAHEINKRNPNQAIVNSKRLMDIFGDRYYIELHVNHLEEQIKVNKWLVKHAQEFDIPMIAAVDSHYALKEQHDDHQVWLSIQTSKDVSDESSLFGGGQQYHMADEAEVFGALGYLDPMVVVEAIQNTVVLADRCDAKITPKLGMPLYHAGEDAEQRDADLMLDMCLSAWDERVGYKGRQDEYMARFERESRLLIDKGFPGYFLMNADLVHYAKNNGVLVGPGRGSGAGSLVAYLLAITEVDPVENDLLFERFMTEGRTALPDFDIDYPSTKKQFMLEYAQKRWGKKHVCAVGTITLLKNKGAFKDTARAIQSRLPSDYYHDVENISKIISAAESSTAGLGLKWDELMDVCEEEFAPYKKKYPYLFEMAEKFRDRVKTYSKHAAGLILDPQADLESSLPMRLSSDGTTLVTQFDKDVLDKLGYVKFDFLNLRNLDTLQITVDLIKEQLDETINVYRWRDEYKDPEVFSQISAGWTLGMFQIETSLGTKTVKQLKPENLNDLADCITLGRPGPIRSGLDRTYFRRREGREKVSFADDRLAPVLSRTYGTMIYQEDIMATCMVLATYDDDEADKVRKILGKKKPEEAKIEGKKFIERAVANHTNKAVAEKLWSQMEEFSRYSFNRAHAFAYAVTTYWTAWFKIHYPVQFATAILSTIDKEEIPDWVAEARRLGFKVLPPDINESGSGFTNTATTVRYGLDSIKGIAGAATKAIMENQPYISWDDFLERRGSACNMGHIKTLAHVGAFDTLVPNRKALEARLNEEDLKPGERCIFYQLQPRNKYNDLPCAFDWDSEPKKLGRTGKPLKTQKPPPAKCSKACRNWTPRKPPSDDEIEPYTEEEIRQIEMETLGIYLSSSPFDVIDDDDMSMLITANQLQTEPNGYYLSVMLITKSKDHRTKDGKPMKFITGETPSGTMDVTVFSDKLAKFDKQLRPGQMVLAEIHKNDRGLTLRQLEKI